MKNNLIRIAILSLTFAFVSSCANCGFSEKCHRNKEKKRIVSMTKIERDHERQDCVRDYEYMISITKHKKKKCNFWNCIDGKDDLKKRLDNCLKRLDIIESKVE